MEKPKISVFIAIIMTVISIAAVFYYQKSNKEALFTIWLINSVLWSFNVGLRITDD